MNKGQRCKWKRVDKPVDFFQGIGLDIRWFVGFLNLGLDTTWCLETQQKKGPNMVGVRPGMVWHAWYVYFKGSDCQGFLLNQMRMRWMVLLLQTNLGMVLGNLQIRAEHGWCP